LGEDDRWEKPARNSGKKQGRDQINCFGIAEITDYSEGTGHWAKGMEKNDQRVKCGGWLWESLIFS